MRASRLLILVMMVGALLAPDFAQARAGGGSSFGSRGSRSFSASPSGAQPLQRSTAPRAEPTPSGAVNPGGYNGASHPFLSGLAGGVIGAGIGHMLFGSGGMGGGGGGLLPLLLIGGLIYGAMRMMRARNNMQGNASVFSVNPFSGNNAAPMGLITSHDITVSDEDIAAFKQLLVDVQRAWSDEDFNRLRQYMTPEMLQYFNDTLSANVSRGLSNKVEQVEVIKAQPVESWQEADLSYASVIMGWTARDYMVRLDRKAGDADYIASGDAVNAQGAQEQWTFSRVEGGRWLLSAIQQL